MQILKKLFQNNRFKLNKEKPRLIVLGNYTEAISINIDKTIIENGRKEKLLGIILDGELSFKEHIATLCKEANQKLHPLSRISIFMDTEKLRKIVRAFIISQFWHYPLNWINHGRNVNKNIYRIQEKALQIIYQNPASDLDALLHKDNSAPIHVQNLQVLMIEVFKSIYSSLRNGSSFKLSKVQTKTYGIESSILKCRLWNTLINELKTLKT